MTGKHIENKNEHTISSLRTNPPRIVVRALLDFVSQIKRAGGKALIKTFHHNNNYDNALAPSLKQLSAGTYFGQRRRESKDSSATGPVLARLGNICG